MQLIFMYGPPAVGKLTVAEKLSEISGIPLFHNHLSRDIVKDIYRVDNESRKRFKKLSDKDVMVELTKDMGIFSIPFVESLKINTSRTDPDESARVIQDRFNLIAK